MCYLSCLLARGYYFTIFLFLGPCSGTSRHVFSIYKNKQHNNYIRSLTTPVPNANTNTYGSSAVTSFKSNQCNQHMIFMIIADILLFHNGSAQNTLANTILQSQRKQFTQYCFRSYKILCATKKHLCCNPPKISKQKTAISFRPTHRKQASKELQIGRPTQPNI